MARVKVRLEGLPPANYQAKVGLTYHGDGHPRIKRQIHLLLQDQSPGQRITVELTKSEERYLAVGLHSSVAEV